MLREHLEPVLIARLYTRAEATPIFVHVHAGRPGQEAGDGPSCLGDELWVRSVEADLQQRAPAGRQVQAPIAEIQPEGVGICRWTGRKPTGSRPSHHASE